MAYAFPVGGQWFVKFDGKTYPCASEREAIATAGEINGFGPMREGN